MKKYKALTKPSSKQFHQKKGRIYKQHFFEVENGWPNSYKKVLIIAYYQRNVNQNNNEILLPISQNNLCKIGHEQPVL